MKTFCSLLKELWTKVFQTFIRKVCPYLASSYLIIEFEQQMRKFIIIIKLFVAATHAQHNKNMAWNQLRTSKYSKSTN